MYSKSDADRLLEENILAIFFFLLLTVKLLIDNIL